MKLLGRSLLLLLFFGCKKDSLKAPDAFYVKPNSIDLNTNFSTEGTKSAKITDLWLYVNGNFKGAYPSGNILPIVSYGPTEITLLPGIKNNGISTTRIPYEFYQSIKIDTAIASHQVFSPDLVFKYKTGLKFHVLETFETGTLGLSVKTSANSDVTFTTTPISSSDNLEGRAMYFTLDAGSNTAQFQSNTDLYQLPPNGVPVYMELNFKCNQPFDVGVYSGSDFRYCATANSSSGWNKIYVSLIAAVSTNPQSSYGFYFRAQRQTTTDGAEPYFFIDNVKIISY